MLQNTIPTVIAKIETDYHHVAITKGEHCEADGQRLFDLIKCATPMGFDQR